MTLHEFKAPPGRIGMAILLVVCSAYVSGCTETDVGTVHSIPVNEGLALSDLSATSEYLIGDNDDLTVRFYFNPQLDEDLRVRPDGRISLSLVGEVEAAGKTPVALSEDITTAYAKYLVKPTAVVLVRRFASARAFIAGQVRNPGIVDMNTGQESVLEGIATVGGVTDEATLEKVILIRRLPHRAQPVVMQLNLLHALDGTQAQEDVTLLPNDLVYVPRSGVASVNLAMHQYVLDMLDTTTNLTVQKNLP